MRTACAWALSLLAVLHSAMISCCCYTSPAGVVRRSGIRSAAPNVRVRLSEIAESAQVSCDAGMWLQAGGAERKVERGQVRLCRDGSEVRVDIGAETWRRSPDTVFIRAAQDKRLAVNSRSYRGALLAFVSQENELVVVNELNLEEYLFGVVPCEIGPIRAETFEAVKAQAVAARTFTLSRLGSREGLGFQLYDSFRRDQEYRGAGSEVELACKAVEETRGEVLTHGGQIAEALYHANCGGVTANGSQPYLKSVRDTPGHRRRGAAFCSGSKNYSWSTSMPRSEFEQKLAQLAGREKVGLRSLRLENDRVSGRVRKVHVNTRQGSFTIAGTDFRFGIGLKSTLFELSLRGNKVVVDGRGWGHGSGMCQDGAIGMARKGYSYRQILMHYYSGVALEGRY
jgi:stage II sporulation protein D